MAEAIEEAGILGKRFATRKARSRLPEDFVRKTNRVFSFIATAVMAFGLFAWCGSLQAQNASQPPPQAQQPAPDTQQPPDTQAKPRQPQTSDQDPSADANGPKEFIGTVVKQGDKYVFQDAASGTTYDIDHQDEVKKFEGKKVRVRGTLDANGKMIHVQ
jgi:hypothetical protein